MEIFDFLEMIEPAKEILRLIFVKMRHKVEIEKFDLKVKMGAGNASTTGVVYGAAWGFYSSLYAFLSHCFYIKKQSFEIVPDFYNKKLDFEIETIIKVRLLHVIRAILKSSLIYLKYSRRKNNHK
ncbi:MAG: DUF2953 domain-containing protein [Clostridiales bacterium]|jgi:hypothetical protein|nr:DUF2953 domain-containing protein [Clostridiales bacterium]